MLRYDIQTKPGLVALYDIRPGNEAGHDQEEHDGLMLLVDIVLFPSYTMGPVVYELWGCKNRPTSFPGWMSYKATKPGLVCISYLSMLYY